MGKQAVSNNQYAQRPGANRTSHRENDRQFQLTFQNPKSFGGGGGGGGGGLSFFQILKQLLKMASLLKPENVIIMQSFEGLTKTTSKVGIKFH